MGVNNRNNIVTNGLILYLDAANQNSYITGSTTWKDMSGFSNNAGLINNPTFINSPLSYFFLNNSNQSNNQYFNANTTDNSYSALTFIALVYITNFSWGSTQAGVIFNNKSPNITGMILNDTDQSLGFTWNNDSVSYSYYTGLILPNANTGWSFIAVSVSPTLTTFCVNNKFNTFIYNASSTTIGAGLILGADDRYGGQRRLVGNVSIFQIYNRALSQVEITQNYNAYKSRFNLQ